MCRAAKCCFCVPLRIGGAVVAGMTIAFGIFACLNAFAALGGAVQNDGGAIPIVAAVITFLVYLAWLIGGIFLIVALCKNRKGFALLWIIITIILICIAAIAMIIILCKLPNWSGVQGALFIQQVAAIIFCSFALVGVCPLYKNNMQDQPDASLPK